MDLHGKSAIVTGSSRGIGKAIALRFARDGARVAVNCVATVEQAEAVAREIREAGGEAIVLRADVSRREEAERLIAGTIAAFGKVDILVSNAGIVIDRPYVESTDEDWARAIENNLHGFFNVTRAVLPHMIQRKQGRIIATGSCITEVADFGGNKYSVCTASKGGIVAMLKPMAAEVARHGVTVNAVSPGYIATEMLGEIDPTGLEATLRIIPMRRYGKPDDIAAAMAFLASDDAGYITGQVLRVNGGMSMGG
ncbi:MAG TPA: 3-oxoacyl-ACP reductase family protein [Dongiaceae bacterium]|nr:3-oxoacyl-ACP reductase family protein [Dongiaceae bacterium]